MLHVVVNILHWFELWWQFYNVVWPSLGASSFDLLQKPEKSSVIDWWCTHTAEGRGDNEIWKRKQFTRSVGHTSYHHSFNNYGLLLNYTVCDWTFKCSMHLNICFTVGLFCLVYTVSNICIYIFIKNYTVHREKNRFGPFFLKPNETNKQKNCSSFSWMVLFPF